MKKTPLDTVILQYVKLDKVTGNGWHPCVHIGGCDTGHKGSRAAWMLNGDDVVFNCFNCGVTTGYSPSKHKTMPNKMVKVFKDFNIPDDSWQAVIFSNLEVLVDSSKPQVCRKIEEPKALILPDHFKPLGSDDSEDTWDIIARDYLLNRNVDPDSTPFYISTGEGLGAKKWKGRIIIPIYKNNNLIFYLGRSLVKMSRKYESPNERKDTVLCGFDRLFEDYDKPLYVVEGWFDAYAVDGVAVLGNKMTTNQIAWLEQSNRRKVIIPDKLGDGHILAEQGLALGWDVSIPKTGDCKDTSEAVSRFGKIYTLQSIVENTMSGVMAQTAINMFCKQKK